MKLIIKFDDDIIKSKYIESKKFEFRSYDSSIDLMNAKEKIFLKPFETRLIDSGIRCQLLEANSVPSDTEIQIRPRSGLSSKGIHVNFGTIDSGYTGKILVSIYNATEAEYIIEQWDRIAQLVVAPILKPELDFDSPFIDTERGDKGIGSSGK